MVVPYFSVEVCKHPSDFEIQGFREFQEVAYFSEIPDFAHLSEVLHMFYIYK